MAALDFPASPTVGQTYPVPPVVGVPVYTWDGEKWTAVSGASDPTPPATQIPLMDATPGVVGVAAKYAREDHVHPTDTSRAPFAAAMAYSGLQINGAMDVNIDGTASVTTGNGYPCDGWLWARSTANLITVTQTNNPGYITGFDNYITVAINVAGPATPAAGDYVWLRQTIEAWRTAHLSWGTANASPITVAFWSGHQTAGVYGLSIQNGSNNYTYATTYTHAAAGTPQYNVITIPGATGGSWERTSLSGIRVYFPISIGSTYIAPTANTWNAGNYFAPPGILNVAASTANTVRIGGVIVLPGIYAPTAAQSPLIVRPFDQESMACKRYYTIAEGGVQTISTAVSNNYGQTYHFPVTMRAVPTVALYQMALQVNCGNPVVTSFRADSFLHYAPATGTSGMQYVALFKCDARL